MIGWLKAISKPGSSSSRAVMRADQILLGLAGRPGVVGMKHDECLEMRRGPRIGAVVIAADVIDDG